MAKRISLTQSKFAIVDDEDYEWLMQWKWYFRKGKYTNYADRKIYHNGRLVSIQMHREILGLQKGDGKLTDHKNHNGLNNRKNNLRICTTAQNQQNQNPSKNCSSKYKGVCWHKLRKKWYASICRNYKQIFLGRFDSEIDAAKEYDSRAKELFGEFAKVNFS